MGWRCARVTRVGTHLGRRGMKLIDDYRQLYREGLRDLCWLQRWVGHAACSEVHVGVKRPLGR